MNIMKKIMPASIGRWLFLCVLALTTILSTFDLALPKSEDIVTIACIDFRTTWGDKTANLERIKGYIVAAAKRGAHIILFPECALTGYDIEEEAKMHKANAETIPGPSTNKIAELTRKYGVYVVVGMAEKDKDDPNTFYNSAAIIGPEGVIGSYAKLMPFKPEMKWCKKGKKPFLFNTTWGPFGVAICYDTYMFPELPRYYAALGSRLYLHITAISDFTGWEEYYFNQINARVYENMMFVASSNIVGKELTSNFRGGSFIVGPAGPFHVIKYYAGPTKGDREEIVMATINLSEADRMRKVYPLFTKNPISGVPDFRLKLYRDMFKIIDEKTDLGKYD